MKPKHLRSHPLLGLFLSLGLTLVSHSSSSYAGFGTCLTQQVEDLIRAGTEVDPAASHEKLLALIKKHNIPAFMKKTPTGEIPVVMVNAETMQDLGKSLTESMGTQIQLQPDWNNDHGILHVGEYIIDVDTPGARGYGEINRTGLAWKKMSFYLPRRGPEHYVVLEVNYQLSPLELKIAQYYQRVRRAAVFRVKFTFGGGGREGKYENQLENGGEHCFIFCKGSGVQSQISEIQSNLKKMGVTDVDELINSPEIADYLDRVQKRFLRADPTNPKLMTPDLLFKGRDLTLLRKKAPAGTDPRLFAEWLVALDSSKKYRTLLSSLKISSDIAVNDINNPRASALFIYEDIGQEGRFFDATYESGGKFYKLRAGDQRPLTSADFLPSEVRALLKTGYDPSVLARLFEGNPALLREAIQMGPEASKPVTIYRGLPIALKDYRPTKAKTSHLEDGNKYGSYELLGAVGYASENHAGTERYRGMILEYEVPEAALKHLEDRFYPNARLNGDLIRDDRWAIKRIGLIDFDLPEAERRQAKNIRWLNYSDVFDRQGQRKPIQ